jgi:excisionase family DNA binding protein
MIIGASASDHPTYEQETHAMTRTMRPPAPPLLCRVEEAAEALRLSRTAIYELIGSGRLRTVKAGSRRLVPVAALAEYVASLERAA